MADTTDSLGLGKLGGFDLAAMLEPAAEKFREIDLTLIREDGENPREEFDAETLAELAETVKTRGVITPISVRADPDNPDGFVVNHGHRRLRAAKIAGLSSIPAVIDETFRDEDRIIENIQRDNLGMFEVAKYVGRKLAEGMKQKDIARRIGKSTAYVSNHAQLLELPPATAGTVAAGKTADLTSIVDLAKMEKRYPDELSAFLAERGEITRQAVREFRERIENPDAGASEPPAGKKIAERPSRRGREESSQESGGLSDKEKNGFNYAGHGQVPPELNRVLEHSDSVRAWRYGRVVVEHKGRRAMMVLEKKPRNEKSVWLEYEDGDEGEATLAGLVLLAVVAG